MVADTEVVRDTEGARDGVTLVLADRDSVASVVEVRDVLTLLLADRDSLRVALADLVSVGSTDELAVTLLDTEVDPVSDAVKLGDTGDFVKDGVGVGDGMITV